MLIEFHILQDHGPSNMNRGEDGRPKTAHYAGTQRLRISSQCLKRTIREPRPADRSDAEEEIGVFEKTVGSSHFGVRTKLLPEKVAEAWQVRHGDDAPFVAGIKAAVSTIAKKDGKEEELKADGKVRTPQAIYIDLDREVDRIVKELNRLHEEGDLDSLADESKVFADNIAEAAEAKNWEQKSPEKKLPWRAVQQEWSNIVEQFQELPASVLPKGLDLTIESDDLTPDYEFASNFVDGLISLQEEQPDAYEELLKTLKVPKGNTPKRSGKSKSLAALLKVKADQYVSAADIALFGRMTTSDAFQDVEAACQVADAISTHPVHIETDYFTAIDDLDPATGAAHIGEADFASAVFYKYISVDFDALKRNLGANLPADQQDDDNLRELAKAATEVAARSIEGMLRALMQNVPSGKVNSHAHNQPPSLILVEVKPRKLPMSYLTAFHDPARAAQYEDGSTETVLTDSVRKLLSFAWYRHRKLPVEGTQRFLFAFDEPTEEAIARLRDSLKVGTKSPLTDDDFFSESNLTECNAFDKLVTAVNKTVTEGGAE